MNGQKLRRDAGEDELMASLVAEHQVTLGEGGETPSEDRRGARMAKNCGTLPRG